MRGRLIESSSAIPQAPDLQRAIKRGIDLSGSFFLLFLLAPLLLLITFLLKISSSEKIIYRQARIGKDGKPFSLLKFRTMRAVTTDEFQELMDQDSTFKVEYAEYQKLTNDPRLTPMGKFLRRYSLDELPQLWNVVRGEMSLVGPRPFLPEQIGKYGSTLWLYTQVRPGLTGLWQISGRNKLTFQQRIGYDHYYLENWSNWTDLAILFRTPWVVILGKGAY